MVDPHLRDFAMAHSPASFDLPVLDTAGAILNLGSDEIYQELARIFLQDLPAMRDRLGQAGAVPALPALIAGVHEVANSLGIIGALRGERLTRRLEQQLREEGDASAPAVAQAVLQALQQAEAALVDWLRGRA